MSSRRRGGSLGESGARKAPTWLMSSAWKTTSAAPSCRRWRRDRPARSPRRRDVEGVDEDADSRRSGPNSTMRIETGKHDRREGRACGWRRERLGQRGQPRALDRGEPFARRGRVLARRRCADRAAVKADMEAFSSSGWQRRRRAGSESDALRDLGARAPRGSRR